MRALETARMRGFLETKPENGALGEPWIAECVARLRLALVLVPGPGGSAVLFVNARANVGILQQTARRCTRIDP
jgi:hypothetical protein